MVLRILIGLVIGGAIGGLLGATRSCETGGCPLTANPYRGALFGAVLGVLFALSLNDVRRNAGSRGPLTPAAQAELSRVFDGGSATGILVFGAEWCGACRSYAPVVAEAERRLHEAGGRVVHVDVEASPDLARGLNIQALPTTVVIRDGREIERHVGALTIEKLLSLAPRAEPVSTKAKEKS